MLKNLGNRIPLKGYDALVGLKTLGFLVGVKHHDEATLALAVEQCLQRA